MGRALRWRCGSGSFLRGGEMQSDRCDMSRRASFGVVGAIVCIVAGVAFGDAQSDYTAIFGKEAARVAASASKADDVTFAKKLLESAAAVSESPKLQVLLYE